MENTKCSLSLDFNKPRHPRGGQAVPSLVTPILNLTTPEVAKMISEDELAILTPTGLSSVLPQSNVLPSPLIPTTVNNNNIINKCNGINQNQSQKKRPDKNREIDVDKIEKKRERNRLAAKKCRQRKLETIEELRKTVSELEEKNERLEKDKAMAHRELEELARQNAELKSLIGRRS